MRSSAFTLLAIITGLLLACGEDQPGHPDATFGDDAASLADATTPPADATAGSPDATSGDGGAAAVRILPLGDSLTLGYGSGSEGTGSEGGYRIHLAELLDEAGIAFDFVGSQSNGPASLADQDHEGYNGYSVGQVAEITNAALDSYQPDVVLLMAGTNDQITFVPPSQPPADAAADLELLIEQIDTRLAGVQIIVAQVIPLSFNDVGITEYNALIPAIVADLSEQGINVRLVDMYAIGTASLSGDGIHPTAAGYDLMADIWSPAVLAAIADL
jgi:lysophospholipase L1-like esterase